MENQDSREKRKRRIFSPEYKLSVIEQAENCQHGELGRLLQQESLHSNQLSQWRRAYAKQGMEGLSKSLPGPRAKPRLDQAQIEELEREILDLREKLRIKTNFINRHRQIFELLEQAEQLESLQQQSHMDGIS